MKNLIYYPYFEPKQDEWLKIALLYLDKISPIIPSSAYPLLSEDFNKIREETDLIAIHKPRINEANRASHLAVSELDKIIKNPHGVVDIFNNANILRHWKQSKKDVRLFHEKYTQEFEEFCIRNRLAEPAEYGMNISASLSHIYMTILSNEIAFQSGSSSITDDEIYDDFALYIKAKDVRFNKELETAKNTIQIAIPRNLSDVPLDSIIKLRNDKTFRQMVKAFQEIIEEYHDNLTSAREIEKLLEQLKEIRNDISAKLVESVFHLTEFVISIVTLRPDLKYLEFVKELLTGARVSIKMGDAVTQFESDNERYKFCRQYLINLEKL